MLTLVVHPNKKNKSLNKFTLRALEFAKVWFEKSTYSGSLSDFDSIRDVISEIFTLLSLLIKVLHDALLNYSNFLKVNVVHIPSVHE